MTTIKEIRTKNYKKLPQNEVDLLISFIIKKDRVFTLTYPEYGINKNEEKKILELVKKRISHYPMAYILGYKEFYGNKFLVNKNVLIPRPETELMVEEAFSKIKQISQPLTIIDIGTGSGCIAISLAKLTGNNTSINFYAIDISTKALNLARKNAKLNSVGKMISFIKSDLLTNIPKSTVDNRQSTILITANLPYLTPSQIKSSPSIKKEPRLALIAGADGLKYYRKLFKQISQIHLVNPSINFTIFCEIDPSQKTSIKKISKEIFPNKIKIWIKKDLRKHSRLAILKIKNLE